MELELKGNIIGVISNDFSESNYSGKVKNIVLKKASDALKMVGLDGSYLELDYEDLSLSITVGGIYGNSKVNDAIKKADKLMYEGKKSKRSVVVKKTSEVD